MKLVNCLQVKTTYDFLTIVFRASFLAYLRMTIIGMKRDTLIEHKESTIVCEESGHASLNYNVLLTGLEANTIVKESGPVKAKGVKDWQ